MFFTFDDDAKARLHIRFSEKRLAEAKAMTELGKPEWAEGLMEDYIEELNETYRCMQRQKQRGKPVTDLAEYVCNATDEHAEIISDFVDEVSGQTKPHIAHAMNASYRGHTRALREIAGERGLNVTEIAEHVGNMTYKYKHVKEAGTHGKGRGQK